MNSIHLYVFLFAILVCLIYGVIVLCFGGSSGGDSSDDYQRIQRGKWAAVFIFIVSQFGLLVYYRRDSLLVYMCELVIVSIPVYSLLASGIESYRRRIKLLKPR